MPSTYTAAASDGFDANAWNTLPLESERASRTEAIVKAA